MVKSSNRRNKIFKIFFLLFFLIVAVILLELSAVIVYPFITHTDFNRIEIQQNISNNKDITSINTESPNFKLPDYVVSHILHPYLGFVCDTASYSELNINQYGFIGPPPILKKSESCINICITGGSVAAQLFMYSYSALMNEFDRTQLFQNKQINIVSVALGGYKQPQQLMAMDYFIFLGAEYDIMINIDGINEVSLSLSNIIDDIFPYFPRNWKAFSNKGLDLEHFTLAAELLQIKDKRKKWRTVFNAFPLRHSNYCLSLWKMTDNKLKKLFYEKYQKFEKLYSNTRKSLQTNGPEYFFEDKKNLFADFAKKWANASRLMSNSCKVNNVEYFHFLQPNQYFRGSKELTEEEKQIAYVGGKYIVKEAVQEGYGFFVKEGATLKKKGVNFHDLTMIFKDEKRTIYTDVCCHYNNLGYDIIARKIVKTIEAYYLSKKQELNEIQE